MTEQQLEAFPFVSMYMLYLTINELKELEFVETTGKTSGLSYIIHHSRDGGRLRIVSRIDIKKKDYGWVSQTDKWMIFSDKRQFCLQFCLQKQF